MRAELNQSFRVDPADLPSEAVIFGCTPAMREVQSKINLLRSTDHPVLIQGESGTGKEVVARFLHARSNRSDAPFVKLNCAAIPCDLLEIELFGCVNRVSTRAREDRPGLVEIAKGGSIFLDEIGELDWGLQGRLLDLLQGGSYCPIGAHERRTASVRLICASNVDLQGSVQRGKFREGLLSSIDAGSLRLSALRERKGDIPQLCDYLLQKLARQLNRIAPQAESLYLAPAKAMGLAGQSPGTGELDRARHRFRRRCQPELRTGTANSGKKSLPNPGTSHWRIERGTSTAGFHGRQLIHS